MAVNPLIEGGYYQYVGRNTVRTMAKLIPYPERTGGMTYGEWKALKESYYMYVPPRTDICVICKTKIRDTDRPVVVEYEYYAQAGEYMICRYCYEHFDEYEAWRERKKNGYYRKQYGYEVWFTKPDSDEEIYSVRVVHDEEELLPVLVEQFGEGTKLLRLNCMGEERVRIGEPDKWTKKYSKERKFRERDLHTKYYQR